MDYSLIVGIHDCDRVEPEGPELAPNTDSDEAVSGDDENGYEYEQDSPDIGGFAPTPPDSPQPNNFPAFNGDIDPSIEKFGIKCAEGKDSIFFILQLSIWTCHILSPVGAMNRTIRRKSVAVP